jgi:pimeloyl-ACP methyl ester carboxylesterase
MMRSRRCCYATEADPLRLHGTTTTMLQHEDAELDDRPDPTDAAERDRIGLGAMDVRSVASLLGGAALTAASGMGLAFYADQVAREAERLVPPDGAFIEVPGARLHVVDTGAPGDTRQAIVMVHGLGGQSRNFAYALVDRLAPDHRLIVVDRPGSGYSRVVGAGVPGIVEQGLIIAALIETLGLKRPLMVGHSFGGAVSLALALERPELVRGLALLAPLTQVVGHVPAVFKGLAALPVPVRHAMAQTIGTPLSRVAAPHMLDAAFAPETAPADFAIRGGGVLAQRPSNIAAAAADLGKANEALAALALRYGQITVPVSILFGRDDRVLDPALHGRRTADAIPGARFKLIDGGHMILVTAPERTAKFIAKAARR